MTNWGAHGLRPNSMGTRHGWGTGPTEMKPLSDGPNAPVAMRYANGVAVNFILEPGHGPMGGGISSAKRGKLEINRNKFASNPPEIGGRTAKESRRGRGGAEVERRVSGFWQARWHMQDWLDCIRSGQPACRGRRDRAPLGRCLPSGQRRASSRPPPYCTGIPPTNSLSATNRPTVTWSVRDARDSNCQRRKPLCRVAAESTGVVRGAKTV